MPKISEARRAQRRAQILDAARACFLRQGLHATTMDDIIAASGLSAGAVYGHFPGKEALILAAVTSGLSGMKALLDPLLDRKPTPMPATLLADIIGAIAGATAHGAVDLKRLALLGWSEAQTNPRLAEAMRGFYVAFRDRLAAHCRASAQAGSTTDAATAEEIARAMLALVMGFVAQAALLGDVAPAAIAPGAAQLGAPAAAATRGARPRRR